MKRTIWFLLIGIILLTGCGAPRAAAPAVPTAIVVTQPQPTAASTAATAAEPAAKPAAEPTANPTLGGDKPVPVTGTDSTNPEAVVTADALNLRAGPGLNYRVLAVLPQNQKVRLEGRSQNSEWIVVRLPDGSAGWAFNTYLQTNANLASLPMLEASGGPLVVPSQPQPQPTQVTLPNKYSLYMTINDNQALVALNRFPAESEVTVRLSVRGGGPSMTVATGKTDTNGAASFSFEMPRYWPDGSRVTQSELRLVASTADGSVQRSANVVYYSGE